MYPVQVMISYFTTSFTVIMHIGREVTAKQYTGGGLQDSKGTYVISNYWLPPVCHSVWNDRSMTMFV